MTTSLRESYLAACSKLLLPTNSYVLQILQKTGENLKREVVIKITGNDRRMPVQKLSDGDIRVLSHILRNNLYVTGLDFRYNMITDEGAKHFADLLQENTAIKSINLMCNDIEAAGAELIAKSLHRNETLRTLRMTGNKMGNQGALHFAAMLQVNATLEELDVSDCDLGIQSLIAFAIALNVNRSIRVINVSRPLRFSHQEETTVHLAQMLKVNQHLREMHLGKHSIRDFGVERLCEALSLNFALRYLDLRCNSITRDGAKCLAQLLKRNGTLEVLDLSSNRIEDDGAVYLSEAVALHSCGLKALSITSNNIGSGGLLSLAEAMTVSSSLTHIYIWGNKLEEPVCGAISALIQSGRLQEEATDVSPYEADGHTHLAEVFHGLRRHYYWTPSSGQDGDPACNSALALTIVHDNRLHPPPPPPPPPR